jgi:NAD(P)H-hydrate epimerase
MKLCTPKQMQNIDRRAIDVLGIPGLELMENAGNSVLEAIQEQFGDPSGKAVAVICGKGNNGGDGFVVARKLYEQNAIIELYLVGEREAVTGDARTNLIRAEEMGLTVHEVHNADEVEITDSTTLIVDAIFGTGFSGDIKEPYAGIIRKINEHPAFVAAVDAPSGLDGATGEVSDPAVMADITVTFGLPKYGQAVYPGKSYCGYLMVADIGFPDQVIEEAEIELFHIMEDEAAELLPHRAPDSHKGDFGKLFVLAGSTGLTGAAVMASEAGLRSGAGLVILGCPSGLNDILEIKLTEVMTKPLPEVRNKRCFALRGLGEIREMVRWADAVAVGPGIGTYHETRDLVFRLLTKLDKPAVFDADALNILAKNTDVLRDHSAPLVISPHPGEMSRLTGKSIEHIENNRIDIALEFAAEFNLVCILKGAPSVIAAPSGQAWINSTGNDGMATAGSGDVLTGLIGGFLAQGLMDIDAAVLGCYIHGYAGDLAAEMLGPRGMIAGDILEMVPEALARLEEG